ncbi:MAG: hypothetical protein WCC57_11680 [Paracoccaceae bacterium]
MTKLILAMSGAALGLTLMTPVAFAAPQADGFNTILDQAAFEKRRKPRVPGGSGCDDAGDAAEHPECR